MFDNLGTAIVQAVGFFGVFGFFIYQLLLDVKQPNKAQIKISKKKAIELKDKNYKTKNRGLFTRKIEPKDEQLKPKKKGLFRRTVESSKNLETPKKKGWFK